MGTKLKIKYRKKEDMYVVDYSRVANRKKTRFELLQILNKDKELVIFIDTSLGKIDKKHSTGDYYDFENENSRKTLVDYLIEQHLEYRLRSRKRESSVKMFGISTGKRKIVEDILVAVVVEKEKLSEELFDYLLCTHDYSIGIDATKDLSSIIREFSNADYIRLDEMEWFDTTLVDSHFLGFMYTGYKFEV